MVTVLKFDCLERAAGAGAAGAALAARAHGRGGGPAPVCPHPYTCVVVFNPYSCEVIFYYSCEVIFDGEQERVLLARHSRLAHMAEEEDERP